MPQLAQPAGRRTAAGVINPPQSIRTPRLHIRIWRPTDAPLLKAAIDANVEHLGRWLSWAKTEPTTLKALEQRIEKFGRSFHGGFEWCYGIFSSNESALYGGIGLHPRIEKDGLEIGFWLQQGWTRQGFATEAVSAIAEVALAAPGVNRVQIRCDARNAASARVAQRAGFRHRETLPGHKPVPSAEPRDTMVWELARAGSSSVPVQAKAKAPRRWVAALSLLLPGLGQLTQGRWLAALIQLGTVAGYVAAALRFGDRRALALALAWNLWSAADAYLHAKRR